MKRQLLLASGTVLQSRYRIVRQLGIGGMGAVYEAVDERISKSVAVKETFAEDYGLRKAFEREAKLLARIEHRAFPQVTDYFADGEGCYLVMDLIRGEDFSEIMANRIEPFEPEQVCAWADEILDSLETLHAQNIIHRDIKPSNLKLTPKGNIKLLDFGIAKGTANGVATGTVSSMAAVTVKYAPLEQVLRANSDWYFALSVNHADKATEVFQKGTDPRSDLYAFGATLYEMLTKRLPENAPTRALALWSGQPDKLIPAHISNPQVSKQLSVVLQKVMELDIENRPLSAAQLRTLLKEAIEEKEEKTVVIKKNKRFVLKIPGTEPLIEKQNRQPNKDYLAQKEFFNFYQPEKEEAKDYFSFMGLRVYPAVWGIIFGLVVFFVITSMFSSRQTNSASNKISATNLTTNSPANSVLKNKALSNAKASANARK